MPRPDPNRGSHPLQRKQSEGQTFADGGSVPEYVDGVWQAARCAHPKSESRYAHDRHTELHIPRRDTTQPRRRNDMETRTAHIYRTETDWIAAYDRDELLRLLEDGHYDEPELDAVDAEQLDALALVTVGSQVFCADRRPEGSTIEECEPYGDGWDRKITAAAVTWSAWACDRGDDYHDRVIASTEY
jgi:hypothetical protein